MFVFHSYSYLTSTNGVYVHRHQETLELNQNQNLTVVPRLIHTEIGPCVQRLGLR